MSYYMQGEISQIKAVLARFCDKSDTSIILRIKIDETEEKVDKFKVPGWYIRLFNRVCGNHKVMTVMGNADHWRRGGTE